jgi:hypothetical protein
MPFIKRSIGGQSGSIRGLSGSAGGSTGWCLVHQRVCWGVHWWSIGVHGSGGVHLVSSFLNCQSCRSKVEYDQRGPLGVQQGSVLCLPFYFQSCRSKAFGFSIAAIAQQQKKVNKIQTLS